MFLLSDSKALNRGLKQNKIICNVFICVKKAEKKRPLEVPSGIYLFALYCGITSGKTTDQD